MSLGRVYQMANVWSFCIRSLMFLSAEKRPFALQTVSICSKSSMWLAKSNTGQKGQLTRPHLHLVLIYIVLCSKRRTQVWSALTSHVNTCPSKDLLSGGDLVTSHVLDGFEEVAEIRPREIESIHHVFRSTTEPVAEASSAYHTWAHALILPQERNVRLYARCA